MVSNEKEMLLLEFEYYPILSEGHLLKNIDIIKENAQHWEEPFFMDVYKYADMELFRKVCSPFMENKNITNLIILGTGGSYQTMKALSLFSKKKIHFLTNSRPYELNRVLESCTPDNSLVIPISRGGKTLDINSILPLFKDYPMLALSSQGPMYELVKELNATILPVPDLSGRFAASVCSVALVPALLSEINVEEFQKGLSDGYAVFKIKGDDPQQNFALVYASFLYELYKKGYRNVFSMPYSVWLEGAVGLFVQEISESSGKENKGLMGTYQEAPLCQHSVLELLLGGSKGHTTPLLWTLRKDPKDLSLIAMDPNLEGQTALSVINYQLDATFQALLEQGVPSAKISLREPTPYTIGYLISFIQSTVYYYCLLSDVNWSSNPMVNRGKKICNEALAAKASWEMRISARKNVAENVFKDFFD